MTYRSIFTSILIGMGIAMLIILAVDTLATETPMQTGPVFTAPPRDLYRWPDATGLICFSRGGQDSSITCYPPAPTDQP